MACHNNYFKNHVKYKARYQGFTNCLADGDILGPDLECETSNCKGKCVPLDFDICEESKEISDDGSEWFVVLYRYMNVII